MSAAESPQRATAVAIHLVMASIIGGGPAPWGVGRMSDVFRPGWATTVSVGPSLPCSPSAHSRPARWI